MTSTYASSWFLTLFSTGFPFQITLRVWDIFMHEGPRFLFRVALALMKLKQAQFLACTSIEAVLEMIKTIPNDINADQVITSALAIKLTNQQLTVLEQEHKRKQAKMKRREHKKREQRLAEAAERTAVREAREREKEEMKRASAMEEPQLSPRAEPSLSPVSLTRDVSSSSTPGTVLAREKSVSLVDNDPHASPSTPIGVESPHRERDERSIASPASPSRYSSNGAASPSPSRHSRNQSANLNLQTEDVSGGKQGRTTPTASPSPVHTRSQDERDGRSAAGSPTLLASPPSRSPQTKQKTNKTFGEEEKRDGTEADSTVERSTTDQPSRSSIRSPAPSPKASGKKERVDEEENTPSQDAGGDDGKVATGENEKDRVSQRDDEEPKSATVSVHRSTSRVEDDLQVESTAASSKVEEEEVEEEDGEVATVAKEPSVVESDYEVSVSDEPSEQEEEEDKTNNDRNALHSPSVVPNPNSEEEMSEDELNLADIGKDREKETEEVEVEDDEIEALLRDTAHLEEEVVDETEEVTKTVGEEKETSVYSSTKPIESYGEDEEEEVEAAVEDEEEEAEEEEEEEEENEEAEVEVDEVEAEAEDDEEKKYLVGHVDDDQETDDVVPALEKKESLYDLKPTPSVYSVSELDDWDRDISSEEEPEFVPAEPVRLSDDFPLIEDYEFDEFVRQAHLNVSTSRDWKQVAKSKLITVWYQKPTVSSDPYSVKFELSLPGIVMETAFERYSNADKRVQWDLGLDRHEELDVVSGNETVVYTRFKKLKGSKQQPCDVMEYRKRKSFGDSSMVVLSRSCKHPADPLPRSTGRCTIVEGGLHWKQGLEKTVVVGIYKIDFHSCLPHKEIKVVLKSLMKKWAKLYAA